MLVIGLQALGGLGLTLSRAPVCLGECRGTIGFVTQASR